MGLTGKQKQLWHSTKADLPLQARSIRQPALCSCPCADNVKMWLSISFWRRFVAYFYFADALWLRALGWDSDSTLDFLFCKELFWVIPKRHFNLSSDIFYFSISSRWEINFHLAWDAQSLLIYGKQHSAPVFTASCELPCFSFLLLKLMLCRTFHGHRRGRRRLMIGGRANTWLKALSLLTLGLSRM